MKITAEKLVTDLENRFWEQCLKKVLEKLNKMSQAELQQFFRQARLIKSNSVTKFFADSVAGAAHALLKDKFNYDTEAEEKSIQE